MLVSRLLVLFVAAWIGAFLAPSPAEAWTRAVVGGARAVVELDPDATVRVLLRLDLEVQAGWLQELELAGLGSSVSLDGSQAPYLRSEEGEIFRPEVEVDERGSIHLSFSRREAPRRGEYRVFLRYRANAEVTTTAVGNESRARVVWSVPAWETGLQGVSVELRAPKGATVPTDLGEPPAGVEVRVVEQPKRTVIEWNRIHLPRLTPWPLTIDVPSESMSLPPAPARQPSVGFKPLDMPKRRPLAWVLLVIAALALLKRKSIELFMGPELLWVRASWARILGVTAVLVGVGQWWDPDGVLLGLSFVAFALHRTAAVKAAPTTDERWNRARFRELPAEKPRIVDYLDATTGIGMAVFLLTSASLWWAGKPHAILLLLPLFSIGTRHHRAPSAGETADVLRRFASDLRWPAGAPGVAMSWEIDARSRSRIRLHLPRHRTGLLALAFVVGTSSHGLSVRRRVMLLVQTRAQSDADDLVRRRMGHESELREPDGSISRLFAWNGSAVQLVRALSHESPAPVKASRGTWLLREISEPSQRAA